jgi:hypothetical protein
MNRQDFLGIVRRLASPWVILGGIGMSCILMLVFIGAIFAVQSKPKNRPIGTVVLNVIPAPSDTVISPQPTVVTPTPTNNEVPSPPGGEGISVGVLVQVSGTGSDGLRIRIDPSLQGQVKFVGIETEVFQVKDGPREADGYTWWFLVAPYDETLNGWAVGDYLQVIQNP